MDHLDEAELPRVYVLGRLRVVDAAGVERIPHGEPVRTLLLFLALSGASVHVEHAIDILWPDVPTDHGSRRLRNVVARLNAQCGHIVVREGSTLALRATTDLTAYTRAVATLLVHAGQEIAPDARYADWAEAARQRLQVATGRLADLIG